MRPHSRQATWLAWLAGPNNVGQVLSPCLTRDGWSMACPFPTLVLSKVQPAALAEDSAQLPAPSPSLDSPASSGFLCPHFILLCIL